MQHMLHPLTTMQAHACFHPPLISNVNRVACNSGLEKRKLRKSSPVPYCRPFVLLFAAENLF
jgi:hypothetical protein